MKWELFGLINLVSLPKTYQDYLELICAYTDFSKAWRMILIIFNMKFSFLIFSLFFIKIDGTGPGRVLSWLGPVHQGFGFHLQ